MSHRFSVERQIWQHSIELRFGLLIDGAWHVAQPIQMQKLEGGEYINPMLSVPPEAAQMLMDELWRVGLRPSEGTGSAGSLAATERHLADMRRIALEALEAARVLRTPDVVERISPGLSE